MKTSNHGRGKPAPLTQNVPMPTRKPPDGKEAFVEAPVHGRHAQGSNGKPVAQAANDADVVIQVLIGRFFRTANKPPQGFHGADGRMDIEHDSSHSRDEKTPPGGNRRGEMVQRSERSELRAGDALHAAAQGAPPGIHGARRKAALRGNGVPVCLTFAEVSEDGLKLGAGNVRFHDDCPFMSPARLNKSRAGQNQEE